ncbi:nuclear pore RNA shuttling protein Mtr2 [Scheffersomyces xylosifermentans]|uniref:nuclear pore RNA shuttling protein Mtr2 n=1 Tax=Scheffersomyces xylosifermentans TaxID=1304137 RepID=UPI00315CF171
MSHLQQDPTQPIEPFLKKFLSSLDIQYNSPTTQFPNVESYATQFAKSLKPSSAVIVNGTPLIPTTNNDSKLEFQKKWLQAPNSFHQLNSYDCHLIPGTGTFIINLSAKVKFDESGKSKLGESADLIQDNNAARNNRPLWGSWFGVNIILVVDEVVINHSEGEVINSLDYRFTFKPEDSVVKI